MKLKKVKVQKIPVIEPFERCDFCNKLVRKKCDLALGCEEYALPDFKI